MATLAVMAIGTVLSAGSALKQGANEERQADFQAKQLEREGNAEFAQGTREQHEQLRRGRINVSNARAAMAASGGTTTDPGAIGTLAELDADATYNGLAAMYGAKSRRKGRETQADSARMVGRDKRQASQIDALSTVISGAYKARTS